MKQYTFTRLALIAGAVSIALISCRKEKVPANISTGGKGGQATIKATPMHHSVLIDSCTIYIKYNSLDAPANDVYDDSTICIMEAGSPTATFTNLKTGNYYLFGKGYDPAIKQAVKGGTKITITDSIATRTLIVPVTEGD